MSTSWSVQCGFHTPRFELSQAVEVTVRVEVCIFPRRSGFAFSQTARVRDGVRPGFVLSQAVEAKVKVGVCIFPGGRG